MYCSACGSGLAPHAVFCSRCGLSVPGQRRATVATLEREPAAPVAAIDDLQAALAARQELGERLEPEVVQAFLERTGRAIDARVESRLAQRLGRRAQERAGDGGGRLALAIISLVSGIPITVIAGEEAGLAGMLVAWLGIAGINFAYGWRRRED